MKCLTIPQATDDRITYTFNVGNLAGNTIVSVNLTSPDLTLTNIVNDDTSISVTVDSTGFTGKSEIDFDISLSNGDLWNRNVKFSIGDICF